MLKMPFTLSLHITPSQSLRGVGFKAFQFAHNNVTMLNAIYLSYFGRIQLSL